MVEKLHLTSQIELGSRKLSAWEEELLGKVLGKAENILQIISFSTRRAAQ